MAQIILLLAEVGLAALYHIHHNQHAHGQNANCHQRHQWADGQHHAQHAHHHGDVCHNLRKALVQRLGDGIHIVGDAAQHLAVWHAVKIRKRHAVYFFRNFAPHGITHLGGHACHNPALHIAEKDAGKIDGQQEQKNLPNGGKIDAAGAGKHGHHALKQLCGGLAQHLGPKDGKHGGGRRTHQYGDDGGKIAREVAQQLCHGALEVLGLFPGHHAGSAARAAHMGAMRLLCHYANSSFESWLCAISR